MILKILSIKLLISLFILAVAKGESVLPEVLSKAKAFQILKTESPRWAQANLLTDLSQAQVEMAKAAQGVYLGLTSRQVYAKINQIQFGFEGAGALSFVSFGNTGLVGAYSLYDAYAKARFSLAEKNQIMNQAQRDQYQSDLTALMLLQYLNISRLEKKLTNCDLNIHRAEEIQKAAQMKFKVGGGLKLDELRAKNLLEYEKIKKLDIEAQLQKAKSDLAITLGQNETQFIVQPLKYSPIQSKIQINNIADRKDLLVSKRTIDLAQQNKIMADTEYLPKISMFGEAGISGATLVGGSNNALTGSVGAQLTMPIYDSGLAKSKRHEASINLLKAQLQDTQVEREAKMQIESARHQLENSKRAFELSESQIEASQKELELAQKRFQSGSTSGLEIANSQSNMAQSLELNIDALFGFEVSKLNLYKSLGRIEEYLKNEP